MKKISKLLYWAICLGSIVIGGTLLVSGVYLGGATSFSIGSNGLNFYKGIVLSSDELVLHSEVIDEQVTSINLDLEFTEVVITSGDELTISYTSDIGYKIRDNRLEIISTASKSNRFGMYLNSIGQGLVEITVPDYVTSLDIETSSKVTLTDLSLDKIALDVALGNALVEHTTANTIEVETNLGDITLNDCSFNTLKAELDMGRLTTSNLEILKSGRFENDMGSMYIDLSGDEHDYNFISSVDMGSWSINGNETPSFYGLIDIYTETTMGSASITTK